eukprot:Skav215995  [mRNA]  locus=scaffold4693:165451:169091:+ [translate_table: standard]
MLAKSLVRSSKGKAAAELETTAATMRLSDSMSKSAEALSWFGFREARNEESISSMKREMMRAGLIDEMLDEGMEEMVPGLVMVTQGQWTDGR